MVAGISKNVSFGGGGSWGFLGNGEETPVSPDSLSNRPANVLSEEQKVALLGRPKLGENTRLQIRVKESKEFKVRRPSLFHARRVLILGQCRCDMFYQQNNKRNTKAKQQSLATRQPIEIFPFFFLFKKK